MWSLPTGSVPVASVPVGGIEGLGQLTQDSDYVYLLDVATAIERELLEAWIAEHDPGARSLTLVQPGSWTDAGSALLAFRAALRESGGCLLRPLRVVWMPPERDGRRARLRDVVLGDPRHPSARRQRRLRGNAEAFEIAVADAAGLDELRRRHHDRTGPDAGDDEFEKFVARQAVLALERAEYRIVGAHHKVPRLVREEIEASARFSQGVADLAAGLGRSVESVREEAVADLDEMAAGYSRLLLDAMSRLGDFVCRPGYGEAIDYEQSQVDMVRDLFGRHPMIVLPSHKSQLDGAVIPRVLRDTGVPPTHIFAGINMSFGPFAPVLQRMGRIFIRRTMQDDPVYRWVLREYIGYLLEKRFHLEWYMEGTRSRTGKMVPPKLGLLRYVVDAFEEGRSDDVMLLPVSIMYDELHEIADYTREARGGTKEAEGLGWAYRYYRAQRGGFGRIYVRFGEPLSLKNALLGYADGDENERRLHLQKIAFEVCWRINHATPITGSALLTLLLLATRGRALNERDLHEAVGSLLDQAKRRRLPIAASARSLDDMEGLRRLTESLVTNGTLECYSGGPEPVYRIAPGKELTAAYYRNTAIHYFVGGAIGEIALIAAADRDGNRIDAFWDEVFALRDVLKFDFFFAEKDDFRKLVTDQLSGRLPEWEDLLAGSGDHLELLRGLQPLVSFAVLRPFIEAYGVVARVLERADAGHPVEEKACIEECLALGTQLAMQGALRTEEAVSKILFATGFKLAAGRGLTEPGDDLGSRRRAFAAEMADINHRIDVAEDLTYAAAHRSIKVVGR